MKKGKTRVVRDRIEDVILRARLHRALGGRMSAGTFKMTRGEKLFVLWLTPGAPPPGPFG